MTSVLQTQNGRVVAKNHAVYEVLGGCKYYFFFLCLSHSTENISYGVSHIPQGNHEELILSHFKVVKTPGGRNLQPDLHTKYPRTQCRLLSYLHAPQGPI